MKNYQVDLWISDIKGIVKKVIESGKPIAHKFSIVEGEVINRQKAVVLNGEESGISIKYVDKKYGSIQTRKTVRKSIKELSYLKKGIEDIQKSDIIGYGELRYNLEDGVMVYDLISPGVLNTEVDGIRAITKVTNNLVSNLVIYQIVKAYSEGEPLVKVLEIDERDLQLEISVKGYKEEDLIVIIDKKVGNKKGVQKLKSLLMGSSKYEVEGIKESLGVDIVIVNSKKADSYIIIEDKLQVKVLGIRDIIIGLNGELKLSKDTEIQGIRLKN